ncbi:MAG: lipid II flippase MurJ [Actinomycetaceae bacterium]|nr:lipid II flippase MurJ [Actinomycetaceae bacterium]
MPTDTTSSHGLFRNLRRVATGAVGTIALATLASRIVGFGRWLAQSAFVGSGATAGAYASANQIPNIIFEIIVGGALAGLTVPLLAGHVTKGRHDIADRIASALLTWVTSILTAVAVAVFLGADVIAQFLPVPKDADIASQHMLIANFLRIFAWQIPLYGVSIVLTGILQSKKRFLWPALAPLFASVVVITTFTVYGLIHPLKDAAPTPTAVLVLGWGTTAGVAALSLPLFIPVYRSGTRLRLTYRLEAKERRRAVSLGIAGLGALLAQQLSVVVGLWLMRTYGAGGTVAVFQYVQAVYWLPYAILAYPLATAAFPTLSEQGESGCDSRFCATCSWATTRVLTASLVGVALLITMAPVAEAFFTLLTPVPGMASALIIIAPALVGYSLLFHGQRVLYAINKPATAWHIALGAWLTVSVSAVGAVRLLTTGLTDGVASLRGLAAGHSIGMTVGAIAVLVAIRIHAGISATESLIPTAVRALPVLIGAAVAGLATTRALLRVPLHAFPATVIAGLGGVMALGLVLAWFGRTSIIAPLAGSEPRHVPQD